LIAWKKQASAWVGPLQLTTGQRATAVLVGARDNPRGAAIVMSTGTDAKPVPHPLMDHLDLVPQTTLIEILCHQERAFGSSGLTRPLDSPE
jgi:hypothetical protein